MKRKEYKLLIENWRKVISEGFDDEDKAINISGDSLDFDEMTSDFPTDDSSSLQRNLNNDIEDKVDMHDEEIKRFCKLMGIDCDNLKDFLLTQSFEGDLEGNQFDEFGNEIDFDELDEQ